MTCTEGLVALIDEFQDGAHPAALEILDHCREGRDGDFGIGAQFMTEIQGGSDIPSNLLEAEPDGEAYRLFGAKFFCSAAHADYAVVTAKVTGSDKVGTFVVPAWLPGDKAREKRNGCRINRLKWKMGTSELPTAEIEYDGALAYAVGPTDRGVANAVGIVLTLSRVAVGCSCAAGMVRAAREAQLYSEFREVFGQKICRHALSLGQVRDMIHRARRATAAAFKIHNLFLKLGGRLKGGLNTGEPPEVLRPRFILRELIIIQKLINAYDAVDQIRRAMSIFGGHGIIEDFSSLPRAYRDAAVNELWEGPRNVLLLQVFRDILRASAWYPPAEFVSDLLGPEAPTEMTQDLTARLGEFLTAPPFLDLDQASLDRAAAWESWVEELFYAFQHLALDEIGAEPIVRPDLLEEPDLWA